MSNIHFRSRKYGQRGSYINASFYLRGYSGEQMAQARHYHVGDTVTLHWTITEEQYEAIDEMRQMNRDLSAYRDTLAGTRRCTAFVRLVVVAREHTLIPRRDDPLYLTDGGISIVLEGADGHQEDVLRWILLGERPAWAPPEPELVGEPDDPKAFE